MMVSRPSRTLYEISQLNTKGIRDLQAGNVFDAFTTFGRASRMLGNILDLVEIQLMQKRQAKCINYCKWVELSYDASFDSNSVETSAFLFLRAASIEIPTMEASRDNYMTEICWVVLYNLALSAHIYACKLGTNGQQHMRKAHELYEILRTKYLPNAASENAPMLALALHTNIGYIYHCFGMYDDAHFCWQKAKEIMVFALGGDKEIILNLMLYKRSSSGAPAA